MTEGRAGRERAAAGRAGPARSPAGRGGRRRAESERKRQRILEAAGRCFGELGFARAKVETIAAEAGVSNGLLYQFFRSKEELFEVALETLFRAWREAVLPAIEECGGSHARAIETLLRGSVEFARSHPLLPAVLSEDAMLELSRFSDLGGRWGEAYRAHVAGLLRAGIEAGEFRRDLDVDGAADVVCQLHADYSVRAHRPGPRPPVDEALLDALVRFVLDALRRPGAAAG